MPARSIWEFGARFGVVEMSRAEGVAEPVLQVDAWEETDGQSGTRLEHMGEGVDKLDCGRGSHAVALVVPSAAQLVVEMSIEPPLRCRESSRIHAAQ